MIPLDLAIDTAGSFCSVAIRSGLNRYDLESQALVGEIAAVPEFVLQSTGDGDHFERLPELVDQLLRRSSCEARQITRVIVGTGPGSFTGIRIGMSFAKGLAWANRARLIGGCSFWAAASAESAPIPPGGVIAVVSDARRGELFFGSFRRCVDGVEPIEPVAIMAIDDVRVRCEKVALVVTPQRGFAPWDFAVTPRSSVGGGVVFHDHPATAQGLFYALDRVVPSGIGSNDFDLAQMQEVVPTYLREVSAQTIIERAAVQIGRDSHNLSGK